MAESSEAADVGGMIPPPAPTRWSDPGSDPIGDMRRYLDLAEQATHATLIEVNTATLDALRRAGSDAQRDALVPGLIGLWWGVAVHVDPDVPDGKARVTWSDGRAEVIPR